MNFGARLTCDLLTMILDKLLNLLWPQLLICQMGIIVVSFLEVTMRIKYVRMSNAFTVSGLL